MDENRKQFYESLSRKIVKKGSKNVVIINSNSGEK